MQNFPETRLRRLRNSKQIRNLIKEVNFSLNDIIWPIFLIDGFNRIEKIEKMPGVERITVDLAVKAAKWAYDNGINGIALFPTTPNQLKTPDGKEALNEENLINRATKEIKANVPNILLFNDVALDPYTSHGQDGVIDRNGNVLNDESIEILKHQALVQAKSGSDFIAPSDMMDGRIGIIRKHLDKNDFYNTGIMSYSAKYASNFYGPFRNAIGSDINLKTDKKTYQMDFYNKSQAFQEARLDINEGADILMVKPGLPYLDIAKDLKEKFKVPVFSYQVSGEYSMLMSAIKNDYMSKDAVLETMIAFKRAGVNSIFTYFAPMIVRILNDINN